MSGETLGVVLGLVFVGVGLALAGFRCYEAGYDAGHAKGKADGRIEGVRIGGRAARREILVAAARLNGERPAE
jgi:hypothetical protein